MENGVPTEDPLKKVPKKYILQRFDLIEIVYSVGDGFFSNNLI